MPKLKEEAFGLEYLDRPVVLDIKSDTSYKEVHIEG